MQIRVYVPPASSPTGSPASTARQDGFPATPQRPTYRSPYAPPQHGPPPGYAQVSASNDPHLAKLSRSRPPPDSSRRGSYTPPTQPSPAVTAERRISQTASQSTAHAKWYLEQATRRATAPVLGKGIPAVYFPGQQSDFGWHDDDAASESCGACEKLVRQVQMRFGVVDRVAVKDVHERMVGRG